MNEDSQFFIDEIEKINQIMMLLKRKMWNFPPINLRMLLMFGLLFRNKVGVIIQHL